VKDLAGSAKASTKSASIPLSVPSKSLSLKACSTFIIGRYAPWLMGLSTHGNLVASSFRICGSWVGVLPKLLDGGIFGEVLPSAVFTLALSIRCKDSLYVSPSVSFAKAHSLALNHLRNCLRSRDGPFGEELVATSMCLTMAEVRE
jgi:hypothetical protein